MNGAWVPVAIVALVMIMIVMKSRYRYLERQKPTDAPQERGENARLQEEIRALKDRLQVLERITVEKESSLNREIDQLRDR